MEVHVHEPVADVEEATHEYGIKLDTWDELPRAEAIIAAVAHKEFLTRSLDEIQEKVAENGCFIDVKSQFNQKKLSESGLSVWRL